MVQYEFWFRFVIGLLVWCLVGFADYDVCLILWILGILGLNYAVLGDCGGLVWEFVCCTFWVFDFCCFVIDLVCVV